MNVVITVELLNISIFTVSLLPNRIRYNELKDNESSTVLMIYKKFQNYLNGLWGKLASEILMQNWDTALEDLNRLREYIDNTSFPTLLLALQQRTWLIHWSLFIFFNHPKGRELIVEMLLYSTPYVKILRLSLKYYL